MCYIIGFLPDNIIREFKAEEITGHYFFRIRYAGSSDGTITANIGG